MYRYNLSKYVGRPYEKYNCLDLVKEFYLDFFSLKIQDYFEGGIVPDRKQIECLIKTNIGTFEKVETPSFGDLVIINLYGYTSHLGVYIENGKFLHSIRKAGSCLDSIHRYTKMIDGYYRHRERPSD